VTSWFGPQALTVVLPVKDGQAALLEERLEAARHALVEQLARVDSLHFGRLALVPRGDAAKSRQLLLFESNFDGSVAEHLEQVVTRVGELAPLFDLCEDADGRCLADKLRYGSRRTGAFFCAQPALSVRRIRAAARLRAELRSFLRRERERLRLLDELRIVAEARAHLARSGSPGLLEAAGDEPRVANEGSFARSLGLVPLLARSAVEDAVDWVRELWSDSKLDRRGLEARLARVAAGDLGAQRALTHVVEIKPGRFRRRALAAALRFADDWLRASPARRALGSSHFARWVELGDGRLAFLSHFDQSFEAELGSFVEQLGFITSLVWSHTRGFPAGAGALLGGTRDEARFKDWMQAKRVPTAVAYSAYPELSVSEVARAAELREILNGKLDERYARRALELV
jgi:hypothetical protein